MSTPIQQSAGAAVSLSGIRRSFDSGVVAINGLDLDVAPGEFVAILGPSGCGKSTLLRLIAALDQPQAGRVRVDATATLQFSHQTNNALAYVFQDAHLLPWRNVLDNVALPLELRGVGPTARREAAADVLDAVGLRETLARHPNQLSGGQRMRVSLARALVTRPRLLLLDEPFAALDEITRQHLDEQLRQLWQDYRMTVIFVTHSTQEAVFLANRAIVMGARPGRIIEDRRIDLPEERTAQLRGTPEFAAQTRALYEALERGGA